MKTLHGSRYEIGNGDGGAMTVLELKRKIAEHTKQRVEQMAILCRDGQRLKNYCRLEAYGITGDATVYLVLRLMGGATSIDTRSGRYVRRCRKRGDDEPTCVTPVYAIIKKIRDP